MIEDIRLHYYIMLNHETITKFIVSLTDGIAVDKVRTAQDGRGDTFLESANHATHPEVGEHRVQLLVPLRHLGNSGLEKTCTRRVNATCRLED